MDEFDSGIFDAPTPLKIWVASLASIANAGAKANFGRFWVRAQDRTFSLRSFAISGDDLLRTSCISGERIFRHAIAMSWFSKVGDGLGIGVFRVDYMTYVVGRVIPFGSPNSWSLFDMGDSEVLKAA